MRLLLNVIWFVFAGVWMAIGYAFAALIRFILVITIPFGVAALRIGIFALWPFGKTVVRRADAGAGSAIGNILWFLLAGLTIIGIPLGLANFKLIPVTLRPFGGDIVSIEEAERQGLEQEVTHHAGKRPSLSSQEAAASRSPWPRCASACRAKRKRDSGIRLGRPSPTANRSLATHMPRLQPATGASSRSA